MTAAINNNAVLVTGVDSDSGEENNNNRKQQWEWNGME
jgi:hypothetical protein